MTFNSVVYALFLPTVVLVHWTLPARVRLAWVLVASYVFYAAWDWRFLALLWGSTVIDYTVARAIDTSRTRDAAAATAEGSRGETAIDGIGTGRDPAAPGTAVRTTATPGDGQRRRQALLAISVVSQLTILAFFKYFGFFVDSAVALLEAIGVSANEPVLSIILPVGISFYTFQTMSYSIDVYRGDQRACRDPIVFATFVAFFPQLVAGPIERARHLMPQLVALGDPATRPPSAARIESALGLILMGLVKKVVIGDTLAPVVDRAFADPAGAGTLGALAGVVGFALQIYADFAGYTDIARGSARLLGIELNHNFREPYLSRHITEFWRRWHISLSTWLRDYLYVPLGGNRRGEVRTEVNLLVTMLLGGLWHGAGWTFVLWGGLHGGYLAVHRRLRPGATVTDVLPRTVRGWGAIGGTFVLVCVAWVLFRAPDLTAAGDVFAAIGALDLRADLDGVGLVVVMAVAMAAHDLAARLRRTTGWRPERSPVLAGAAVGFGLAALLIFSGREPVPFVYFQF